MSSGWGSLPLLPLRCILHHLSTEDALAAMSTCNHWRTAVLLYEGNKETLKMRTGSLERSLFLARIFRKHVRKLHIYIESESEVDKFMNYILPQFFDSLKLTEVLFIGPSYVQGQHLPTVKLKRILTESLLFKHLNSLKKLAYLGCELDTGRNDNDRYTHRLVEYYSRPFTYSGLELPCDALLSNNNVGILAYSVLNHIIVDYERVSTESLETLSCLSNLLTLSLNIVDRTDLELKPIDWPRLRHVYSRPLSVAINVITMPYNKFPELIRNVLVEGLPLTSIKIMFSKTLYSPVVSHVARRYPGSLRELVWADAPFDSNDHRCRIIRPDRRQPRPDGFNVNPFILLCWQCEHLKRLVIHGYWVWQYDVLGFVRLRKSLVQLEVSATFRRQDTFAGDGEESIVRVLAGDSPGAYDHDFVKQVNSYTEFRWRQVTWPHLPYGLRARADPEHRRDYALREVAHPLGVT